MPRTPVRILIVDDHEKWRRSLRGILLQEPELVVIGEASDGGSAVEQARKLQPDLICLDIGLPRLNGLDAAREILSHSPRSKIVFVSENHSSDIAEAAMRTGASGYIIKSCAANELLPALRAAVRGERFVSAALAGVSLFNNDGVSSTAGPSQPVGAKGVGHREDDVHHHIVGFYSDDRRFLDDMGGCVATALNAGNAVIVVATRAHGNGLLSRLRTQGVDVDVIMKQGRYIPVDADSAVAGLIVEGTLDSVRYFKAFGELILSAAQAVEGDPAGVKVYGEGVNLLWAQGYTAAAIQAEKLCNQLVDFYNVDIWCGYCLDGDNGPMDGQIFKQICAEHSEISSQPKLL